MILLQTGVCDDAAKMTALIMRSCGIPVAVDFTPYWANSSQGHTWNAVITHHRGIPFMGTESNPGLTKLGYSRQNAIHRKMAKVYRRTFESHAVRENWRSENGNDVPPLFLNTDFIDVTPDYMPVSDIHIKLTDIQGTSLAIYICIFDDRNWNAVHWGWRLGSALYNELVFACLHESLPDIQESSSANVNSLYYRSVNCLK